jgi:heme-degrading monooxygenase HmoA
MSPAVSVHMSVPDSERDGLAGLTVSQYGRMEGVPESVITVFRSRLRTEAQAEYEPMAERMLELASAMPGFVELKTFVAEDGERVSIVTFADAAAHAAWRDHPEHQRAKTLGTERFYESFDISVCRPEKVRRFPPSAG